VTPPFQYVLWVVGLAVEFIAPWIGQPILSRVPVDTSHLPERFSQFNLIILGDTLFEVINGLAKVEWHFASIATAVMLFTLSIVIAGRYFIYTQREEQNVKESLGLGQQLIYSHLPFVIGLTLIGAGTATAINEANQLTRAAPPTLWLIVGGNALCVIAALLLQAAITNRRLPNFWLNGRTISLLAMLLVGAFGLILPLPLPFVADQQTHISRHIQRSFSAHIGA